MTYQLEIEVTDGVDGKWVFRLKRGRQSGEDVGSIEMRGSFLECLRELNRVLEVIEQPVRKRHSYAPARRRTPRLPIADIQET